MTAAEAEQVGTTKIKFGERAVRRMISFHHPVQSLQPLLPSHLRTSRITHRRLRPSPGAGGMAGLAVGRRLPPAASFSWMPMTTKGASRSSVSYTHLRAHETRHDLVCRLL